MVTVRYRDIGALRDLFEKTYRIRNINIINSRIASIVVQDYPFGTQKLRQTIESVPGVSVQKIGSVYRSGYITRSTKIDSPPQMGPQRGKIDSPPQMGG